MSPEEDARSAMSVLEASKLTPIESIEKMLQYAAAFIFVMQDKLIAIDCSSPDIQRNISQAYSGFALAQKSVEAIKDELEQLAERHNPRLC